MPPRPPRSSSSRKRKTKSTLSDPGLDSSGIHRSIARTQRPLHTVLGTPRAVGWDEILPAMAGEKKGTTECDLLDVVECEHGEVRIWGLAIEKV